MRDHSEHDVRTGAVTAPPIDDWERQGALRELTRLARDLEREDADAAVGRLGRLTGSQRAAIAEAMERILELGA
ncbi:MAG TPA: hypothetical protein VK904_05950 [Miltoncostaeaceae bacterium]|nr:hypothetical protein [Miltoncostaeaceae bacterium]